MGRSTWIFLLTLGLLPALSACGVRPGPDEVLFVYSPSPSATYLEGETIPVEVSAWSCGERASYAADLYIDNVLVDQAEVSGLDGDTDTATPDRGTYRQVLPLDGMEALGVGSHTFRIETFGTQENCWAATNKTWEMAHTFEFTVSDGSTSDGGTSDGGTSDGGTSDGGTADGGTADGGTADGGTSDGGAAE